MTQIDSTSLILSISAGVIALLTIWFSFVMAGCEAALGRVTRTGLNNLSLDVQTDEGLTDFEKQKKLRKVARVQKLVASRNATSSSASFMRIFMNVLTGVLLTFIVAQFTRLWWVQILIGLAGALIVGFISILVRPSVGGRRQPLDVMLRHARLLQVVVALTPFARIGGLRRRFRSEGDGNLSDDEAIEKVQNEESKAIVDRMVETSHLDPDVADMLKNVVSLSDTLTREIMVPRTDMVCMGKDVTLEQALKLFTRSGFSRIPVIGESVDDLQGMAYLKDAVREIAEDPSCFSKKVGAIARDPLLVPESKPVDDLFHQMQRERQHIAVVVDEYGGIAGLVTIEDAIEQIVGELEDEHDKTQHTNPRQIAPEVWRVPARTPISDIEDIFEIDIDEDDVDTVYGLLTKVLGHVPIVGESGVTHGLRITAVSSAGRRKKVSMLTVQPETLHPQTEDGRQSASEKNEKEDGHE
jgi:CBS domain containing-hemolysin-like protein